MDIKDQVEEVIIDNTETKQEAKVEPKTQLETLVETEKEKIVLAKKLAALEQQNQELKEGISKIYSEFEEFKKSNKKITINDTSTVNTNKELVQESMDPVEKWNNLYKRTKIN